MERPKQVYKLLTLLILIIKHVNMRYVKAFFSLIKYQLMLAAWIGVYFVIRFIIG